MVLSRDASLPSFGSRRARFPALSGTMKALRLPIRASRPLISSLPRPTRFSLVRARRSAPGSLENAPRPGPLFSRRPYSPACSRVDANGISQVFRRSIPCLCSVPGPRSNRRVLTIGGHRDAAPAIRTAKASTLADFGANPRASAPAAIRFTLRVAARVQGLLPAGRLGLYQEGVEPSGSLQKVSVRSRVHPPFLLS